MRCGMHHAHAAATHFPDVDQSIASGSSKPIFAPLRVVGLSWKTHHCSQAVLRIFLFWTGDRAQTAAVTIWTRPASAVARHLYQTAWGKSSRLVTDITTRVASKAISHSATGRLHVHRARSVERFQLCIVCA
jgi:hypothetical protein